MREKGRLSETVLYMPIKKRLFGRYKKREMLLLQQERVQGKQKPFYIRY